jgi:hypothetical protein
LGWCWSGAEDRRRGRGVDGREMGNYYRERRLGLLVAAASSYLEREREREACACSPKGVNEVVVDEREVH